jgi:hypothetical protein
MDELIDSHQQDPALILQALSHPGLMLTRKSSALGVSPQGGR